VDVPSIFPVIVHFIETINTHQKEEGDPSLTSAENAERGHMMIEIKSKDYRQTDFSASYAAVTTIISSPLQKP
jgi:hypothetical protein